MNRFKVLVFGVGLGLTKLVGEKLAPSESGYLSGEASTIKDSMGVTSFVSRASMADLYPRLGEERRWEKKCRNGLASLILSEGVAVYRIASAVLYAAERGVYLPKYVGLPPAMANITRPRNEPGPRILPIILLQRKSSVRHIRQILN